MRILGIESSCDETAIAVVEGREAGRKFLQALRLKPYGLNVLTNLVASQAALHAKYGGVVPEVAAREHVDVIFPLLIESGIARDGSEIDAIAVTAGPGLVPALRVGVELAKSLAWVWKKPLVAVNHLEGHLYSVLLQEGSEKLEFPALALLVSGGHTELILMTDHGQYERIGATRDDAAGEAFDKVAKLLGLGYPGGPAVSKMALTGNPEAIAFPRPMIESGNFDFSFSGLKTAVAVYVKGRAAAGRSTALGLRLKEDGITDICASFQAAVVETLVTKTIRAVEKFHPKSVILAGGVAANKSLRESLAHALQKDLTLLVPDLSLTGDNAAMIAAAGYFHALRNDFVDPLTLVANPNWKLAK